LSLEQKIVNGKGEKYTAEVNKYNCLSVSNCPAVPAKAGAPNHFRYYSARLGSTGSDSGTTNMNVDGSVTPQKFYITSHEDYDLYITGLVIFIGDSTISRKGFGALSALATGWDLYIVEAGVTTYIVEKAKTSSNVIRQTGYMRPYGTGAELYLASDYNASNDDANAIYVPIWETMNCGDLKGVRIGRGTQNKIESVVNDDLTGLVDFTVRVLGYRHYDITE